MLIVMCGLPKSGKSVVAKFLAKELKAELLSTDEIREDRFRLIGTKDDVALKPKEEMKKYNLQAIFNPHSSLQSPIPKEIEEAIREQDRAVYVELFDMAERLLPDGHVILDGTFRKRKLRERAYLIPKGSRTYAYLIYCMCAENVIKERLETRRMGKSKSRVTNSYVLDLVKDGFEPPYEDDVPVLPYRSDKFYHHDDLKLSFINSDKGDKKEMSRLEGCIRSIAVRHRYM